jgi:hypothetical protein
VAAYLPSPCLPSRERHSVTVFCTLRLRSLLPLSTSISHLMVFWKRDRGKVPNQLGMDGPLGASNCSQTSSIQQTASVLLLSAKSTLATHDNKRAATVTTPIPHTTMPHRYHRPINWTTGLHQQGSDMHEPARTRTSKASERGAVFGEPIISEFHW